MTLPPTEHHRVVGLKDGPAYKVGPRCSNPNCPSWAADPHHIWSRKRLGGPFDWVRVEKRVFANKTGVCRPCHDDLTGRIGGHRAKIEYEDGCFHWALVTREGTYRTGLLEPQPLTPELLATLEPDQGEGSEQSCPFCGQQKRRRPTNGAMGRRRASWSVKVPADELEQGAEVLDALVESLAPFVPNADSSALGRYYVLVPVLAYAQMNVRNFVETMEGIGG